MKRILLAEDDPKICRLAVPLLEPFAAVDVVDSVPALEDALGGSVYFDLLVLDRLLGEADSESVVPSVRARFPSLPILVLSAINTPKERARLIAAGADDYVGKPFLAEELEARILSLLRRAQPSDQRPVGDAVIDLNRRFLLRDGRHEALSAKEFLLLASLTEQSGRILSRTDLLSRVWGDGERAERNVVEATITNLRRKVQNLGCAFRIRNTRNLGYWIES